MIVAVTALNTTHVEYILGGTDCPCGMNKHRIVPILQETLSLDHLTDYYKSHSTDHFHSAC